MTPTPSPNLHSDPIDVVVERLKVGGSVVLAATHGVDLVVAAALVRPQDVALMAREVRGIVRVALTSERCDALRLKPLGPAPMRTSGELWNVAVEARTGISTGISAADRAVTARTLADPTADAESVVAPGHVVPVRTSPSGIFGHLAPAEAAIELCRLAEVGEAAVLCQVLDDRGELASPAWVRTFSDQLRLPLVDIEEVRRCRSGDSEGRKCAA